MKVFITGASGFIGSHVARGLIKAGHDVLALAESTDSLWRLKDILPHIEILNGTISDIPSILEQLSTWHPQICIHLAWYTEPGKYLNSIKNLDSLQGSLDLLQSLSEFGCEHFIGAGTCSEYETKSEMLLETDKTKPETLYAASKLSFQMLGEQISSRSNMRFAWGRIFYLYGRQEDPRRIVPSAILTLLKGDVFQASPGGQIRDYLHVTDVANAFLAMTQQNASGTYNICSAKPIFIHEILGLIGELTGRQGLLKHGGLPYREWEPMFICGNNERLKTLGWEPTVDLRSGISDTIRWWKNKN